MKTGMANLPLHYGSAPSWLFEKMTILAREISLAIIIERGVGEYPRKFPIPIGFRLLVAFWGPTGTQAD